MTQANLKLVIAFCYILLYSVDLNAQMSHNNEHLRIL
jgi:hypothetical protein